MTKIKKMGNWATDIYKLSVEYRRTFLSRLILDVQKSLHNDDMHKRQRSRLRAFINVNKKKKHILDMCFPNKKECLSNELEKMATETASVYAEYIIKDIKSRRM